MSTKFLETLGGKLAERWVATLLTPAFVFWGGGLGAWIWQFGWIDLGDWFKQQPEPIQIGMLVGSFLIVTASAFVIQSFDLMVLKFLEGYWPRWMRPLRRRLMNWQQHQFRDAERYWQHLAAKHDQQSLTAEEQDEYVALDWHLRQLPAQPDRLMPTSLGNLLRAAERQSLDKYGLDAIICWPRLWLVLPEEIKTELQVVRTHLNCGARIWLWSWLFLIWSIWAWWAVPVGLVSALYTYRWMLNMAAIYSDLLESAFDLYRVNLYQSLRWPLPNNPAEEHQVGMQLTEYLLRGSTRQEPTFTAN